MYELVDWGQPAPSDWMAPSERFETRLPVELVRLLRRRARIEGVSLRELVQRILSEAVYADDSEEHLRRRRMQGNLLGPGGVAREVGLWVPARVVVASSLEVGERAQNTAVALAGGDVLGTYAKRRLVPFGEAGITPGAERGPIATPVGRLAVVICYESAFGGLLRGLAGEGADVLVLLTNEGWFGDSAGPAQHAAYSRVRAVETGRTLLEYPRCGQVGQETFGPGVRLGALLPEQELQFLRGRVLAATGRLWGRRSLASPAPSPPLLTVWCGVARTDLQRPSIHPVADRAASALGGVGNGGISNRVSHGCAPTPCMAAQT